MVFLMLLTQCFLTLCLRLEFAFSSTLWWSNCTAGGPIMFQVFFSFSDLILTLRTFNPFEHSIFILHKLESMN